MYLINTSDEESLQALANDLDAIINFDHVDLAELNSLSIMEATNNAASDWLAREPIAFSESDGIVIAGFAIEGVAWLRDNSDLIGEFGANPDDVQEFAARCEAGQVYFLDTF